MAIWLSIKNKKEYYVIIIKDDKLITVLAKVPDKNVNFFYIGVFASICYIVCTLFIS